MTVCEGGACFETRVLRSAESMGDAPWAFVVLPKEVSASLPRRGRTTVEGRINGHDFTATLEPDGQLSHWLRLDADLLKAAGARPGDMATFEIRPAAQEPEPELPIDLQSALAESPEARTAWDETTTIARLDWIHWITSAKQSRTRTKRIAEACGKLGSGQRRVCCFDPSGYYSKAFSAPESAD